MLIQLLFFGIILWYAAVEFFNKKNESKLDQMLQVKNRTIEKLGEFYIEVRSISTGQWERFSDSMALEMIIPHIITSHHAGSFGFKGAKPDCIKSDKLLNQSIRNVHAKLALEARAFMKTEAYKLNYESIRISGNFWDPTYDGNGGNSFDIMGSYWRDGFWRGKWRDTPDDYNVVEPQDFKEKIAKLGFSKEDSDMLLSLLKS